MNRRHFLKLLGLGATAAAVPAIVEPVRRVWAVPSNAPVGSRVLTISQATWAPSVWANIGSTDLTFNKASWLSDEHGFTYFGTNGPMQIRAWRDQHPLARSSDAWFVTGIPSHTLLLSPQSYAELQAELDSLDPEQS